jgi:hypothetical protein
MDLNVVHYKGVGLDYHSKGELHLDLFQVTPHQLFLKNFDLED